MDIRIATKQDCDSIKKIYSSAFPKDESEIVTKLAIALLSENTTPSTIPLIAEANGSVVGHITFSPVGIKSDESCQAYILAPLAVQPNYQKRRIGSKLIEYGMQQLLTIGGNIVFVYGDPKYYGRFGFNAETARNYTAPYKLQYPFGWQAIVLNEYILEKVPVAINCVASLCDPKLW
ncbi:N-acetyltransferase [Endozoicomonas sp. SM1973]|uniref:N-acetyltransferase n=1 Tax=Spartinivicinus marinus TaxID=2994442 RepID=A0A853IBD5_9GAMM|nr:N-acetyltransferase [Spartinivicinus marinus]MCX4028493.1 N-acetyltransferase [Spartinivicinus marinus]NYZ67161.1 N-acetyltransferase [Spartinivicinus marinus]